MILQAQTGPVVSGDGSYPNVRTGRLGDTIVSELHGRFYEQAFRGSLFSGGMSALTSISNATFTSATVGATATPIVGVYNPSTSGKNLVILQASLAITLTALTATGGGPFVWAISTGNAGVSTGATPFNRVTLAASGSVAKNVSGVALTGLTTNLSILEGADLNGGQPYNVSEIGTAVGFMPQAIAAVQNFDGSLIVPPGGVLALLATTTPVAHSAVSRLLWEEVQVA